MKFQVKCKGNRFVLISRYASVRIRIWVFALNFGGILREFGEILGKYRILDGRPLGSIGLKQYQLRNRCLKKNIMEILKFCL